MPPLAGLPEKATSLGFPGTGPMIKQWKKEPFLSP
jgi:hypothetical protein